MRPGKMPSRRGFFAATAMTLAGHALAATSTRMATRYQLGCYTRPWDEHDYLVALDGIAAAGYRFAGLMTARGKTWVLVTDATTAAEAAAMGEAARARGLAIVSVYGEFALADSREASADRLRRLIDRCAACGCPSLLLGGTTKPEEVEPYERAVADACDHAARNRIGLCIKPHGGQNATGPQCRALIERVNHPSFRHWYDPGNILYYSDGRLVPEADARTVAGLVVGMSVKDFRAPKDVLVTPGDGQVDFPAVLARLAEGGFTSGPMLVECLKHGDAAAVTAAARTARERLEVWLGAIAG